MALRPDKVLLFLLFHCDDSRCEFKSPITVVEYFLVILYAHAIMLCFELRKGFHFLSKSLFSENFVSKHIQTSPKHFQGKISKQFVTHARYSEGRDRWIHFWKQISKANKNTKIQCENLTNLYFKNWLFQTTILVKQHIIPFVKQGIGYS